MELIPSIENLIKSVHPKNIILYSDSSVVPSWLKIPTFKLKTLSQIELRESTSPKQQHHIDTKQNPCDVTSRGLLPNDLVNCPLWWKGPDFLHEPFSDWKPCLKPIEIQENLPELKLKSLLISQENEKSIILKILENSSSLTKANVIVAYMLLSCYMLAFMPQQEKGYSCEQSTFNAARTSDLYVQVTQNCSLSSDVNNLKHNKLCSSKYQSLASFVNEKGVLRVGGTPQILQPSIHCKTSSSDFKIISTCITDLLPLSLRVSSWWNSTNPISNKTKILNSWYTPTFAKKNSQMLPIQSKNYHSENV